MRPALGTPATMVAALTLSVTLAGLLSGCGGAAPATDTSVRGAAAPAKSVQDTSPAPSLPPGDPGVGAPSVPDPGDAPVEAHGAEEARRTVPATAMLTADTVAQLLGGDWQQRDGGLDECVRPAKALGVRSRSYGGTGAGVVVETLATYPDVAAAGAAVEELGSAVRGCGWEGVHDPRLGSASVAAEDRGRSMVAVSAEGVVVVLVGTGEVTRGVGWSSLVDLALGSSCPAAPGGCH
jgi:hypothetical protein